MKIKLLKITVAIETLVIAAAAAFFGFALSTENIETEVLRQKSPDGTQAVIIFELGSPDWPFGSAHYRVYGPADFYVDVKDDGGHGKFDVQWRNSAAVVTFSGSEQEDAVYVLPY